MTELELDSLVKRFGDVAAVNGVSLTVEPGNLVALLGPSGCGKTTTLRMVAGLEQPTEGDIRFNGSSIVQTPPHRRNIGMVFQRYVLFPHMSVESNVGFGLRMRGVPKDEIKRRVAEVLEIVQLNGFEKRFPSQLSGGQQQRVAIARTVVTDPVIMLMDEPLSNLDAKLREEMRSFITSLQRRLGITTLFVTHDQVEAIELADQIGVMFAGEIVQFGTPAEIFNHPRSPRIADFMGATNLLQGELGEVTAGNTEFCTEAGAFRATQARPGPQGAHWRATIRPEHLELAEASTDLQTLHPNRFRARITEAVYYGGLVSYKIAAGNMLLTVRDRSTRQFPQGEEVVVHFDPAHLWIFPEGSTEAEPGQAREGREPV
jgi:putative spermidine/putrescine transport system ATP-binding protein